MLAHIHDKSVTFIFYKKNDTKELSHKFMKITEF